MYQFQINPQNLTVGMIEIISCKVRSVQYDGLCGFSDLMHKPMVIITTLLSDKQCQTLVETKSVKLRNVNAQVDNIHQFMVHDGYTCEVFIGEVISRDLYYDFKTKLILLEGKDISISKGFYVGQFETYIWKIPSE